MYAYVLCVRAESFTCAVSAAQLTAARRNSRLEIGISIATGSANEGKCHALCNKQTPAVGVKRRVRPADRLMAAACGR